MGTDRWMGSLERQRPNALYDGRPSMRMRMMMKIMMKVMATMKHCEDEIAMIMQVNKW
jgi:hypothetical protein